MRNAFADEVTKLAKLDSQIILLSGDIGNKLFDKLREQNSNQFINCGIAEQNMMGVAAGMAMCGLRPIVYTIAPFNTIRCLEQIKLDVAYHKSPVVIVGTGSGLSYSSLGPSHHSLEDFAILKSIPNMQIFAPWDAQSVRVCLRIALESKKPTYIRIGKKGEKEFNNSLSVKKVGSSLQVQKGKLACILAVGTIAQEASLAGELLKKAGIDVEIILNFTIKPEPVKLFNKILKKHNNIVIVEEHSKIGGFGESFLSYVAKSSVKKKIITLGTDDHFMPIVGTQNFARSYFRIDAKEIVKSVKKLIEN